MRVLWVCNIMLPMVAEQLHMEASNKEGWLSGLASVVLSGQRENGIELAVAFPAPVDLRGQTGGAGAGESAGKGAGESTGKVAGKGTGESVEKGVAESAGEGTGRGVGENTGKQVCQGRLFVGQGELSWYGFFEDVGNAHIYDPGLEPQMRYILKDFLPDVVHCFGTEYPHTLAMCRVIPDKSRLLVGIQGLCMKCAEVYFDGIPESVARSVTLRDFLKKDSLVQQKKKFAIRGETEQEVLRLAGNVTGRTAWDKGYVEEINPSARYFQMNETLRSVFYEGEWQAEQCERYSIFLSQGDYPIKGLHYMLQALPKICEAYPETKVYVAGNSIVNYRTLKDKLKISGYGRYLIKLIKENGLEGRLHFLGRLDAEQMKERYLKSNLFVCCSTVENSPNSLGEAMILGVPCVSADVGGISSIFTGGKDGILYKSNRSTKSAGDRSVEGARQSGEMSDNSHMLLLSTVDHLANAVISMWTETDKMEWYRENARNHAGFTHNKEKNYERLTEIYAKIAEGKSGAMETTDQEESTNQEKPANQAETTTPKVIGKKPYEPQQIVFVSNYINHHQIPFCNAMYEQLEGAFTFIQTEPMEEERIRMGWQDQVELPYLKRYYQEPETCRRLIDESEVVIYGGIDDDRYVIRRLEGGRPVIRYSERLYKEGQWKAISPRGLLRKYHDHTKYRKKEVYLLCAGAYVPSDFHIVRAYPGKMLKWGYFPETRHYDIDRLMSEKKPATILWAARFLDWKHPELALECAKWLKDRGMDFHMDIVGDGELRPLVERLVRQYDVVDQVSLRGYCSPQEVRNLMEQSDIYLATSDRKEGWGAVINEAMNSGCAVVASHMMGASPYLIKNGENGFLFKDGQKEMLFELTERLLKDRKLCEKLGRSAIRTIGQEWNAENAAARLLQFCVDKGLINNEALIENRRFAKDEEETSQLKSPHKEVKLPESGPCSKAEVVSERRMFTYLTE